MTEIKDIPRLVDYIDRLCESPEAMQYITPRFFKLEPAKKVQVLEAICREAVSKSDPTELNIKDVAKQGSIAVGSLYTYFTNRNNMLEFTVQVVRDFIIQGMEESEKALLSLNLKDALYYYCIGGKMWSDSERLLAQFFYKAAYSGNRLLIEKLVRPAAVCFRNVVINLLREKYHSRFSEKKLQEYADFVYLALLPLADSLIYGELEPYFVPRGISDATVKRHVSWLLKFLDAE